MNCRHIIFLFILVFLMKLQAQPAHHVEPGRVIVKLKPDAAYNFETRLSRASVDTSTVLTIGVKSFDGINRRYRASNMRRVFPHGGKYEAKQRRYGLHLWYEIIIPDHADPEAVAESYSMDDNVQISEPRYKIRRMDVPVVTPFPGAEIPDDPNFYRQWNFNNTGQTGGAPGADIRLLDAWEKVKTLGIKNKNVVIAIIDDGVYYDHEDLKANMWESNGAYGYNFVSSTDIITPENHATHVAGIISASTNNNIGVSGIAGDDGFGVKVMTVQILEGNKYVENVASAFAYAANNGAVISQNSWGYDNPNYYQESDVEAINYFINEAGRDENGDPRPGTPMVGGLVIFAAGNNGKDDRWYPAYFDNVMSVAATNHHGRLAWYSNFGAWVDISAPGGDTRANRNGGIYSTSYRETNKNFYEYMQGTSMACPHVAGVAALILSVYGDENFTPQMLRSKLLCSAMPLDRFEPQYASRMGAGLVNALAALMPTTGVEIEKITTLTAERLNAVSCQLKWTVPENAGELGFYTVALTTDETITEENFDKYARRTIYMSKAENEDRQMTVTGLLPDTKYNIAIRNFDNCDASPISNTAFFTTRDNAPPVLINQLRDITLRDVAKETPFYVGDVFIDGDGDEMIYDISVENTNVATARTMGDSVFINPVAAGKTKLTLTADDSNSGLADCSFSLTVTQNYAPEFIDLISEIALIPNSEPVNIELDAIDHEDDPINFNVHPTDRDILIANVNGNILTLRPQNHGKVALRVTASDIHSVTTTETIHVTVEQKYAPENPDQLLVYPNPTTNELWFSFILTENAESVTIRIIDSSGKIMYQIHNENLQEGAHYYNTNLRRWSTGIYYVQYVKNEKIVDMKKVVKL